MTVYYIMTEGFELVEFLMSQRKFSFREGQLIIFSSCKEKWMQLEKNTLKDFALFLCEKAEMICTYTSYNLWKRKYFFQRNMGLVSKKILKEVK